LNAALARNWWLVLLRGILGVVFGMVALLHPGATMLSLAILFSAYLFVDGIFAIASAFRGQEHRGAMLLHGLWSILAAIVTAMWPGITLLVFVWLVAVWALVSGILLLGAAFRLKADHGRWWLVIGAVASLLYGVLLVIAPMTGAIVLTWWIGAYALIFGAALIVVSFKLRAHRHDSRPHPGAMPMRAA
jgi:uncharacterized membrane protein HdeD (DUF308 family)